MTKGKKLLFLVIIILLFLTGIGLYVTYRLREKSPKEEEITILQTTEKQRGFAVHPKVQNNLHGRQYALVVGINDYRYVSTLNYAVNDARAISRLLIEKYRFDEVVLLTTPSDTNRATILEKMDNLSARLTAEDRLLFYFSGHGMDLTGFGGRKTGYLIPIDGKPDKLGATCISMQTIREYASTIFKAKHVLFLLDSCFSGIIGESGRFANRASLPKTSIDELIQLTSYPGGQIITAGRSSEIAREDDTLAHGYFSYYILEALKGPGDIDYNRLITVDELYHYVKRKVLARSNNRQTPQLRFLDRGGEGEFVFVLGGGPIAVDKPTPIKSNFQDAELYFNQGNEFYRKGLYDQAIDEYTKAIKINPDNADAYSNRGSAFYNKGQFDQAIDDCSRAIERKPSSSNAFNIRGSAYMKKDLYDRAIADYTRALELNPQYADAYNNRGYARRKKEQYHLAIADYTRAIELNPGKADFYNNRGIAYEKMGRQRKAEADYEQAKKLKEKQ